MAQRYTEPIPKLQAEVARWEAAYDRIEAKVERNGGIDYKGELAAARQELDRARRELAKISGLFSTFRKAAESQNDSEAANLVVEALLEMDEPEPTEEIKDIAADFVENGLGHYDWMGNWELVKRKGEALDRIQSYLNAYGIQADAREVLAAVEWRLVNTPGVWK